MRMSDSAAGPALIETRRATFGFADRPVVSEVTMDVRPGEVIALLGPNGSGKSTLVRGLLGLVALQAGEVRLFGRPHGEFTDRARIGYVPQRHSLSAAVRATASEVVAVGRLPRRPWWRPASREDGGIVADALAAVGLADRANEEVATFSGGQQRRVLIARALAQVPDVLVMDEPTAGVDAQNQAALADVLEGLAARGTSMVIVTHELTALRSIVTRVVAMDAGRIAFDGTPAEYAAATAPGSAQQPHDHHCLDATGPAGQAGAVGLSASVLEGFGGEPRA